MSSSARNGGRLAPPAAVSPEDDDEDDYMTMTFADTPALAQPETSLQRRERLRREAEKRSRPKSKAELAAEEEARREAALSRSLLEPLHDGSLRKSKGLAMMAKMGFKAGSALGKQASPDAADTAGSGASNSTAIVEPIRVVIKGGREGIGLENERKRQLRETTEAAGEGPEAKRPKFIDPAEYRAARSREIEEARLGRLVYAAQKVAESMDEDIWATTTIAAPTSTEQNRKKKWTRANAGRTVSSRPLQSIPVVWRGLVKGREQAEQTRRMRHDLEQSSLSRLPTYDDADEDEDDRRALGKAPTAYVAAEDLDDEDLELDEFNALPPDERLRRLVEYLRREHYYCFWCKFKYPDAQMEDCPGLTEEDH
ncbi:G-patch domain-containing protein [Lasiosphaeria ovina]|uniref:G-patch domain-containing protein n=1 Tax=Lasiosphaeria ovina TaxID=92902 RepID=A0AAE0NKZ4_9PEZI|nr:G-patch domain-containing protein [Lasiosphaeria ovina]